MVKLFFKISQQPNTTFFPFGETPVRYEVRDHAGNVNNCTVFINVQGELELIKILVFLIKWK